MDWRWSVIAAVEAILLCEAGWGQRQESLRLRIVNASGGPIEASTNGGATWQSLGHVLVPALAVNPHGYTAAAWAQDSAVAATAVNAIHIKVAVCPETGRPMTISLAPAGPLVGAVRRQLSSVAITDIPGGFGIFGGGLGPYVNSPVRLEATGAPLPPDYKPAIGDVWLIIRYEPARHPRYAVIENRAGGPVTIDFGEGPEPVGVVDQPVRGIGRFGGAIYCWPGRVRANHPGVLDVSTAPYGLVGGFQIIPREHAQSPELAYVRGGAAWLIIGPQEEGRPLAGQPPFFAEMILPSYRPDDIIGDYEDWIFRVWSRTMIQVRFADSPSGVEKAAEPGTKPAGQEQAIGDGWELMPWIAISDKVQRSNEAESGRGRKKLWLIPGPVRDNQPMPPATKALADRALADVTYLRIAFPLTTFPPPAEKGERAPCGPQAGR